MNIDIEFWLLLLLGVTGISYAVDKWKFEPVRNSNLEAAKTANPQLDASEEELIINSGGILQVLRSLFSVFLLVVIIRSFLFEPFTIPSSSMEPTLYPGDFVVVNKFHYGIRLPGVKTKIIELNQPERGDVMVFRFPKDEKTNYIKRVIGLPGDLIRYDRNKNLYVNGDRVQVENWQTSNGPASRVGTEMLPRDEDMYEHQIRIETQRPAANRGFTPPMEVMIPEGQYLVLGDNRDQSSDSRYWGLVEDRLIVGRASAIWMHLEGWIPDFSRNGWIQ